MRLLLISSAIAGAVYFSWPTGGAPFTEADKVAIRAFDKAYRARPEQIIAEVEEQNKICIPQIAGGPLPDYAYGPASGLTIGLLWTSQAQKPQAFERSKAGKLAWAQLKKFTDQQAARMLATKMRADPDREASHRANAYIQTQVLTSGREILRCTATALFNPQAIAARHAAKKALWAKRDAARAAKAANKVEAEATPGSGIRGSL